MVEAIISALRRWSVWLALLVFSFNASAHRLDEYLQATLVVIEPDGIKLQINLTPGVAVADQILALIDRDHDGVISTNEAAAYAELLKHDLTVQLDQHKVGLHLTASYFPDPEELRTGSGIIQLEFTAPTGALAAGSHRLTIENWHLTTVSVYLVNAAQPKSGSVQITRQQRNDTQSVGEIEFTFSPPANSPKSSRLLSALVVLFFAVMLGAQWWPRAKTTVVGGS